MPDKQSLFEQTVSVFEKHGSAAAITAFVGGTMAIAAATVRKAFTNEAVVNRIEKTFVNRIDTWERQRQQDREEINKQLSEIRQRVDHLADRER